MLFKGNINTHTNREGEVGGGIEGKRERERLGEKRRESLFMIEKTEIQKEKKNKNHPRVPAGSDSPLVF